MKIVSRSELLTMPNGTLFAEAFSEGQYGEPKIFGGEFAGVDFLERGITGPEVGSSDELVDHLVEMWSEGKSFPVETSYGREGLFDEDARYLVWEPADVASIVAELNLP